MYTENQIYNELEAIGIYTYSGCRLEAFAQFKSLMGIECLDADDLDSATREFLAKMSDSDVLNYIHSSLRVSGILAELLPETS